MIKTIWFFVKIAVLVIASVWLISQPGIMNFNFLGYDVTILTGVFLICVVLLMMIVSYILRMVHAIFSVPKVVAEYRQESRQKAGYKSLTRGLVAVAAGDTDKATQYSKDTVKLLGQKQGLPLLLQAQAARMRGEEMLAKNLFEELVKDRDMAFLGIRGLLKSALDKKDYVQALAQARAALKLHPNQAWLNKIVYTLELKNHHWEEALNLSRKAQKSKAISPQKIISDQIAIHLMRYDYDVTQGNEGSAMRELKLAFKLDNFFVPTVLRYAHYYRTNSKNKKAIQLLENTWKVNAHPELAALWNELAPSKGKDLNTKKLAWAQKLVEMNPNSAASHIAAANVAIELGYWGEAKAYLMAAEKLYPSTQVYYLRAIVEQNISHNDDKVEEVLEKANQALPSKVWTCSETGMVYDEWVAIAPPHDSFNTIIWDVPRARVMNDNNALAMMQCANQSLLIDPAA